MIDRYLPAHELRLVRNPRFREWSAAAQPDGRPDAIVLRFDVGRGAGTAAVAAGRADLMANIGGAPVPHGLDRGRLRVDPLAGTQFLFLNVAAPPFDDVRVRRALNLALDRGRIVRLDGGPSAARPTCQVLPPQLPGYRPYCPYTRHPTPDGRWHGPDLRRARRLVAASRTRGMQVGVWDTREPPFAVNEGRVAVAALRRLGYRATLHRLPDSTYFSYVNDSRNRAQVIDGGWGVDYPATNGFLSRLTCRAFVPGDAPATTDASEFCDPAVDRRIARAAALEGTDRTAAVALWRRLDRELTNRAIWLPTTIAAETDLLSARAGGYRYNPLSGVLLDQLWVR
jgi:peptide/nickel transport system substrate-binding protein